MKTIYRIGVIAVLAMLFLAGCYLSLDEGAGSVGIELPQPRSVAGVDPAGYARVYVLNGPALLTVGDATDFAEFDLTPDDDTKITEVTVGPVPAADGYQVVLVFGDYQDGIGGTEVFVPVEYALSGVFTVFGGQANVAEVTALSPSLGHTTALLGTPLIGVIEAGSGLYTASADSLYEINPTGLVISETVDLGISDATSIDLGSWAGESQVWVNNPSGILPVTASTNTVEALNFGDTTTSVSPVISSGAFRIPAGTATYGFYQFDGGLGGVYQGIPADAPAWMDEADLSDIVAGNPILDLVVDIRGDIVPGYTVSGYFATKLGAFRIDQDDLIAGYTTVPEVFDNSDFFEVKVDDALVRITDLAIAGTELVVGTPKGVLTIPKVAVGEVDKVSGDFISATRGLVTSQMAIGLNYRAILTEHLVLVQAGLQPFKAFPVYAGVSDQVSEMYLDDASGIVVLAGNEGLSYFDIDGLY